MRWTVSLTALACLGACTMENPAYDGGPDEVGEDTRGDTSASESGDTGTSASSSDTGTSASSSDTGTSESSSDTGTSESSSDTGTSESSSDTGTSESSDTGEPICTLQSNAPLKFRVKTPDLSCEPIGGLFLKIWPADLALAGEVVKGQKCPQGCEQPCMEGVNYYLDIPGAPAFKANLVAVADQLAVNNQPLCLTVAAQAHTGMDGEYCLYDVFAAEAVNHPVGGLLVGRNNEADLPALAVELLAGTLPAVDFDNKLETCSCASYWGDNANADCCTNAGGDPASFPIMVDGMAFAPGESGEVPIYQGSWIFDAVQSERILGCEVDGPRSSWALSRNL